MLSYIFESVPLSLKCDGSHGFMFTFNSKKLVELSVSVPLDVESIDKAINKRKLHKLKRSIKNDNIMRSQRKANASKTKMWYDLDRSLGSWDQVVTNFIRQVNNKKNNIRTRVRANALLVCAILIEKKQ